jgi:flagellar hook protein FlgE
MIISREYFSYEVARMASVIISHSGKGGHMSVLGALNTGVSGMDAQAAALSAISNNVANSQTVGYKETDTSFVDYVTQASATSEAPGSVAALPQYMNATAGTPTQTGNPTSLAVSGAGFFPVQLPVGASGAGTSSFSPLQYYTRAGDFSPNSQGYLQNSEGYVLDGFPAANAAGTSFNTNALQPIQISQAPSPPVATQNVSITGNIGSTPPSGTTSYTSSVQIYDAAGNQQTLNLTWSQVATDPTNPISATNAPKANEWDLTVSTTGAEPQTTGQMLVTFNPGSSSATASGPVGTIENIAAATNTPASNASPAPVTATVPTVSTANSAATIGLALNFGQGLQNVALNLGQFGSTNGITQFSGTSYAQSAPPAQDGLPQGNYNGVTIGSNGNVVVNYSNGATSTIAQVPLANFADPDSLQQQSGQAFTATTDSGVANIVAPGTGGTGTMVAGSVEGSNVDIATQFTQMIVAQQAYTANSKVITTANSMLQVAVNMIQG